MAVKWRLFYHLRHGGNDPDSLRIYLWHIEKRSGNRMRAGVATDQWKRTPRDYLLAAELLYQSMTDRGFDPDYPIPIDPNGELLNGSHRVACALALGIGEVVVERSPHQVWAPPWGYGWFADHGMVKSGLDRLLTDWEKMHGRNLGGSQSG